MKRTIPYSAMVEKLDSAIAMAIDTLEGERDMAIDLDVITDDEIYSIEEYLEKLEEIRGEINASN